MLQEFLDRLANVTGHRYTPAQFGKIVKEATKAEEKEEKGKKKENNNES